LLVATPFYSKNKIKNNMKRTLTLIAIMAICSAMMISCKNKKSEPTPEEIEAQKVALADSVLAQIDDLVDQFYDAASKSFKLKEFDLTDAEKMVKPDYLLDPSVASTLVTKSQKINALAIYLAELNIRKIYDMPLDETKEVIANLATEVNHPIDADILSGDTKTSEKLKREYEVCKERGDLAYFWQYFNAIHYEYSYIIAQNPKMYLGKISDDQWKAFSEVKKTRSNAVRELAKYDDEMAGLKKFIDSNIVFSSKEEAEMVSNSREEAIQYYIENKEKYITRRNDLLQ